jgi:hypothetical protein
MSTNTSTLVGGKWTDSRSARFTPPTHWIGGFYECMYVLCMYIRMNGEEEVCV